MAFKLRKIDVASGIFWVEAPDADVYVLCGSPADAVKHLMRRGLIVEVEQAGIKYETGPNCILLSDTSIQGGNFTNLSEFPILQMLYRQGMILPDHPNNTGQKPLLIGIAEQLDSQLEYIHRGNYGLISEEELIIAGVDSDDAAEMMAMKKKFSFGNIKRPEELIDTCSVNSQKVEFRNGVYIQRMGLNQYEFTYDGESVAVDLSLEPTQSYESPYPLSYHDIRRSFFSIIHSGEGDGWDTNRPCMSSVISYQGRIYLIDAGPNLLSVLNGLGINVNEIEGIFHTHGHDDHFAGLTTLMRSDHRIKYYATPLVRESVTKKFCALVNIPEEDFKTYFDIQDLKFDEWSNIEGLEVRPIFSPHPVETSIFYFRALGDEGYRTYGHLADIAAFDVLDNMVSDNKNGKSVSKEFIDRAKDGYLMPVDVKKIDIGGGLIHGQAKDFKDDKSEKLILCHIDREFTPNEKEIGEGAPYGTVDQLIPTYQDYVRRSAYEFVINHFSQIPEFELRTLLNRPVETFNPESTLLRAGETPDRIYLVLTGNVEFVDTQYNLDGDLTAGSFLGELPALEQRPSFRTYRAKSFVKALSFPVSLYMDMIERHGLMESISELIQRRYFLQRTRLFGDSISSPVQERIANGMTEKKFKKEDILDKDSIRSLMIIKDGSFRRIRDEEVTGTLGIGDIIGVALAMAQDRGKTTFKANSNAGVFEIPVMAIQNIPTVRWRIFEEYRRRRRLLGLNVNAPG